MTPRAVVSSVDEPPGRSDLGGRRTPQLQVRATAVPTEAGRGRRSGSPQVRPPILTFPRPWLNTLTPAADRHDSLLVEPIQDSMPMIERGGRGRPRGRP